MGYVRSATVESKGNFALRGDILDIFPVNEENPVRVDFFGDGVEKIKPYNFITGERLPLVKSVTVVAATDVLIDPNEVKGIKDALYAELPAFKDAAAYERAQTIAGDIAAKLEAGMSFAGAAYLLPVLEKRGELPRFYRRRAVHLRREQAHLRQAGRAVQGARGAASRCCGGAARCSRSAKTSSRPKPSF